MAYQDPGEDRWVIHRRHGVLVTKSLFIFVIDPEYNGLIGELGGATRMLTWAGDEDKVRRRPFFQTDYVESLDLVLVRSWARQVVTKSFRKSRHVPSWTQDYQACAWAWAQMDISSGEVKFDPYNKRWVNIWLIYFNCLIIILYVLILLRLYFIVNSFERGYIIRLTHIETSMHFMIKLSSTL